MIFSKAKSRPHGEKCDHNGQCDEGFVCVLEDKIFNPKRICACPNDLDWFERQCVDIKSQEREELAALLSVIIPVSVSVIFTIICVIGRISWDELKISHGVLILFLKISEDDFFL